MKKILIVDDDSTVAKALSELFSRKGFEVICESKAEKALSVMRVQKIDGAVIDCMIPGMNGVDLAKKLRNELNFQEKIVLISGIFKDKNFAKASIKKSAATDFLFKPLDLEELLSIFSSEEGTVEEDSINWLRALARSSKGIGELFSLKQLNVFNVPVLFAGIKNKKASLKINLKGEEGEYVFFFHEGMLIRCESVEKNTFIKNEVLKCKYTTEEQLNEYTTGEGDLISELIDNSMLSPHLKDKIESVASNYLFSDLLFNNEGSINCEIAPFNATGKFSEINLANEVLMNYDLVKNKINPLFIQLYASQISPFRIQLNKNYSAKQELQSIPFIATNKKFIDSLKVISSVSKIIEEKPIAEVEKLLYFLQICNCIDYIEPELTEAEIPKLEQRFGGMLKGIKGKLPEEVFLFLGVEDTRAIFVSTFFKSFAKMNHPDRLPQSAPESLRKLNEEVFSIISDAHGVLVDPDKKEAYEKELNNKKAENLLRAESLKERGQDLLKKSNYKEALDYFEKAKKLSPDSTNTLYYYWCFMKINKKIEDKKVRLEIYNELVAFSIEDKRNELYSLVLGIFYKRSKQYEDALSEFTKALGYNENFLPARRELMTLQTKLREAKSSTETNIFKADLGTVVSNIFKKKAN